MKSLETNFTKSVYGCLNQTFELVNRIDNVVNYRRTDPKTGMVYFEVSTVNVVPVGHKRQDGTLVEEEYETRGSNYGRNAFFCNSMERAELRFNMLIEKESTEVVDVVNVVEDTEDTEDTEETEQVNVVTVRKRKSEMFELPSKEKGFTFTCVSMMELTKLTRGPVYFAIKRAVESGVVKLSGKTSQGRGKPTLTYSYV